MIHHSYTEDSGTVSWGAIRDYHINENGWSDIGYHFGCEMARNDYEVFVGRPLTRQGAHCRHDGMNRKAVGVCLVGNYDEQPPSDKMLSVVANRVVQPIIQVFEIPLQNVVFHREHNPQKTCPGRSFTKSMILDKLHPPT